MNTKNKDIDLLLSFSGDVIASYTLAADYDLKDIAYAIDNLFGEFGEFRRTTSQEINE